MKKSLFTLAAAVAVLASCSNDDALVDNQGEQNNGTSIGFETFTNKATRAENSTETGLDGLEAHHSTFSVWGYKDVQTAYVFGTSTTAGQKVSYADSKWSYTPLRFWDKNSNSYEFYAAAPETTAEPKWTLNPNTAAQNDDYFTLPGVTLQNSTLASTSYVESMKEQANTDYMIADPNNVPFAQYSNAVQLNFNHILSRLNVTVKKGATLAAADAAGKLDIKSLDVCNMANTGNFDESKDNGSTLSAGSVARWATPTGSLTYTGNALEDVNSDKYYYILQSLIMPQTVASATVTRDGKTGTGTGAAPYIKIVYTIGTDAPETYTAYYNLAAVFAQTSLNFNEGWQNTLNITIDADAIQFNPQVYKWEDGNINNFDMK